MRVVLVRWALVAIIVGGLAYYSANVWRYSEVIADVGLVSSSADAVVESTASGTVTLALHDDAPRALTRDGTFGLRWDGGYAQVGSVVSASGGTVTRRLPPGEEPPPIGVEVDLDRAGYGADPRQALGIPFREVTIRTDLEPFPAWQVPGGPTWVIYVHDLGGSRHGSLRMMPTAVELGHSVLAITYRNDPEAAPDPSGNTRYGVTEWRDLHAAVGFATQNGADDVILFGDGVGGSIVLEFMQQSGRAIDVVGLILDSPILNLSVTFDQALEEREVPQMYATVAKQIAAIRYDIRWSELDHLDDAAELDVPVLLVAGTADELTPIETSDAFAGALGENVIYHRVLGAGHTEAWNVDPGLYEARVAALLQRATTDQASGDVLSSS